MSRSPEILPGTVHIVTAPSADPDLLTVKAARMLGQAAAVVFDDASLGRLARLAEGAVMHQVTPWDDIPGLLAALSREGLPVVRLVSAADSAQVAAEVDALHAEGIPVGCTGASDPCVGRSAGGGSRPARMSLIELAFPPLFTAAV